MIVPCPIAATAGALPDHPSIVTSGGVLSYAELDRLIVAAEHVLLELGVRHGDRVAIHLAAGVELPVALWALFRIGALAVLLSDQDPLRSIAEKIQSTGCQLLISETSHVGAVAVVSPRTFLDTGGPSVSPRQHQLDLESFATVIFTSGSQAQPKPVVHWLRNHWRSAEGSQTLIPVGPSTRWGLVIPAHHVGGLSIFFRCFMHQGTVVILDRQHRTPSGIATEKVTHVSIVPTQLRDWLARDDRDRLSDLESVLVGGAHTSARLFVEAQKHRVPIRISYGSTEMASQIATTDLDDDVSMPGYVGRVLPHRSVRVENGEIWVSGDTRFAGYWRDDGIIAPFDQDGWFATGDLGQLDDDRLSVSGRRDNLMISGGKNVHPEEIEEVIVEAGLADIAIVVPVVHDRFGQRPIAFIRPYSTRVDLREALRDRLPSHKIPDAVFPLPDRMDGSKLDRQFLAQNVSRFTGPSE